MSTPIERAAEALATQDRRLWSVVGPKDREQYRAFARRALEAATEDVDELAAVIRAAWIGDAPGWAWSDTTDHVRAEWAKVARAVVARLTKGDENDE